MMSLLAICALVAGCAGGFGSHRCQKSVSTASAQTAAPAQSDQADFGVVEQTSFEADAPTPAAPPSTSIKVSEPKASEPKSSEPKTLKPKALEPAEKIPTPVGTAPQESSGQGPTILPPPPAEQPLITMHTDNLDVKKLLEMLSREAKTSIVVSSTVSGNVTMDIQKKTLADTLAIVARLCNLVIRTEGDVIFVTTLKELRSAEDNSLPIRVYRLNYVKSSDVKNMILQLLSKAGKMSASPDASKGLAAASVTGGGGANVTEGLAMAGGDIVIVQDYEDILKRVDRVIAQIDVQPIQVWIEAVILQVKLSKAMSLGASFAVMDDAAKTLGEIGNGAAINAATGFAPATVVNAAGKMTSGFAGDSYGMKFGFVGQNGSSFIRALETKGETKILAAPRLLVLNKQQAQVQLGDQLGFQNQTTTNTSTSMSFQTIPVGTILVLRPFVSSDGIIRMEVNPQRATGKLDDNKIPQTNTTTVTTNVLIPDGQTIVIGGLIDDEINQDWNGFPFLSRIPFLGYLFRNTVDSTLKKELVVLLTVRIVRPEAPDALNYVGPPTTLGAKNRVSQRPLPEAVDGPSLFEIIRPEGCPPCAPGAPGQPSVMAGRAVEKK